MSADDQNTCPPGTVPPLFRLAELARTLEGARVSYNGEPRGWITHIDAGPASVGLLMRGERVLGYDHCPCCDKPIDFDGWRTSASWMGESDYEVLCFACGLFLAEHFESWDTEVAMSNALHAAMEMQTQCRPEEIPMSRALRARWEGVGE